MRFLHCYHTGSWAFANIRCCTKHFYTNKLLKQERQPIYFSVTTQEIRIPFPMDKINLWQDIVCLWQDRFLFTTFRDLKGGKAYNLVILSSKSLKNNINLNKMYRKMLATFSHSQRQSLSFKPQKERKRTEAIMSSLPFPQAVQQ